MILEVLIGLIWLYAIKLFLEMFRDLTPKQIDESQLKHFKRSSDGSALR